MQFSPPGVVVAVGVPGVGRMMTSPAPKVTLSMAKPLRLVARDEERHPLITFWPLSPPGHRTPGL